MVSTSHHPLTVSLPGLCSAFARAKPGRNPGFAWISPEQSLGTPGLRLGRALGGVTGQRQAQLETEALLGLTPWMHLQEPSGPEAFWKTNYPR